MRTSSPSRRIWTSASSGSRGYCCRWSQRISHDELFLRPDRFDTRSGQSRLVQYARDINARACSMKAVGSPQGDLERRVERVLAVIPEFEPGRLTYTRALPAVASPSFHAAESATFLVAPAGGTPTAFLRLGLDEVADLVEPSIAEAAAKRLHGLGISPRVLYGDVAERATLHE